MKRLTDKELEIVALIVLEVAAIVMIAWVVVSTILVWSLDD